MNMNILAIWTPGPMEMIVIAAVGLIIFGNRLPEVGRSLGKSIIEFKKGIKGVKDEMDKAENTMETKSNASTVSSQTSSTENDYTKES